MKTSELSACRSAVESWATWALPRAAISVEVRPENCALLIAASWAPVKPGIAATVKKAMSDDAMPCTWASVSAATSVELSAGMVVESSAPDVVVDEVVCAWW